MKIRTKTSDKESETDSGEDYEDYKEDPWYHPQGSEANTDQTQPKTEDNMTLTSSSVDTELLYSEEEKASSRPKSENENSVK